MEPLGLHFVDGDLAYLYCPELDAHLQPQGVQLAKAASVGDPYAWQQWSNMHHATVETLQTADALLLLAHDECFLCLDDNESVVSSASSPTGAMEVYAVRVDGDDTLAVGATVELRVGRFDSHSCVAMRTDGTAGLAPCGSPNSRFVMQSDGAPEGAPDWANPRVIEVGRLPAHVPLFSYRSRAAALAREDPRLCLSGTTWGFRLFSSPDAVPAGIESPWSGDGSFCV